MLYDFGYMCKVTEFFLQYFWWNCRMNKNLNIFSFEKVPFVFWRGDFLRSLVMKLDHIPFLHCD